MRLILNEAPVPLLLCKLKPEYYAYATTAVYGQVLKLSLST